MINKSEKYMMITTSLDNSVHLIDVNTYEEFQKFTGHTDNVIAAAYKDGYVYTGSYDSSIRKIDIITFNEVANYTFNSVRCVTILGDYVFIGTDNDVKKLNISDLSYVDEYTGHTNNVRAITNDGTYIYSGGFDGILSKIDPSDMSLVDYFDVGNSHVRMLLYHDGYLYTGPDYGGSEYIYKVNSSTMESELSLDVGDCAPGMSIDSNNYLYISGYSWTKKLNISDFSEVWSNNWSYRSLLIDKNGYLWGGDYNDQVDIIDVNGPEIIHSYYGHDNQVTWIEPANYEITEFIYKLYKDSTQPILEKKWVEEESPVKKQLTIDGVVTGDHLRGNNLVIGGNRYIYFSAETNDGHTSFKIDPEDFSIVHSYTNNDYKIVYMKWESDENSNYTNHLIAQATHTVGDDEYRVLSIVDPDTLEIVTIDNSQNSATLNGEIYDVLTDQYGDFYVIGEGYVSRNHTSDLSLSGTYTDAAITQGFIYLRHSDFTFYSISPGKILRHSTWNMSVNESYDFKDGEDDIIPSSFVNIGNILYIGSETTNKIYKVIFDGNTPIIDEIYNTMNSNVSLLIKGDFNNLVSVDSQVIAEYILDGQNEGEIVWYENKDRDIHDISILSEYGIIDTSLPYEVIQDLNVYVDVGVPYEVIQDLIITTFDYMDIMYTKLYEYEDLESGAGEKWYTKFYNNLWLDEEEWRMSLFYVIEMDLSTEPLEKNAIVSKDIIDSLYELWQMFSPVNKIPIYKILFSPRIDTSNRWISTYEPQFFKHSLGRTKIYYEPGYLDNLYDEMANSLLVIGDNEFPTINIDDDDDYIYITYKIEENIIDDVNIKDFYIINNDGNILVEFDTYGIYKPKQFEMNLFLKISKTFI